MGSSGQLSGSFDDDAFLKILEGVIPRAYFAKNSRSGDKSKLYIVPQSSSDAPVRHKKPGPAEILLDLCLPSDLYNHIDTLLKRTGYKLYEGEIPSGPLEKRRYNYVQQDPAPRGQENIRHLIYIPKELLIEKPREKLLLNSALISATYQDFILARPGSIIIAFSDKRGVLHPTFINIFEPGKNLQLENPPFKGKYVPWEHIQILHSNSSFLANILGLNINL